MRSAALVATVVGGLGALAALGACGASKPAPVAAGPAFDCRDRAAGYVAKGGMRADEAGVQIDCAEKGPRIHRFELDKAGNRSDDAHALTASEFEEVWKQIDGVGWANLHDCKGSGKKTDPVYAFSIHDDEQKATFRCQARDLPYPYNDLVDPLDQTAARTGHDTPSP